MLISEQQHPLGACLAHQARVLQHSRLLARVFLVLPVNPVRHDGLLVKHLQAVSVLAATFILCKDKKPAELQYATQPRRFMLKVKQHFIGNRNL